MEQELVHTCPGATPIVKVTLNFKTQLQPLSEVLLGPTDRAKWIPVCSDSSLHSCLIQRAMKEHRRRNHKYLDIVEGQEIWGDLEMQMEYRNML